MKIIFDARYIRTDFHDGISRYSMELAWALHHLTPLTFLIHDPAQKNFLPKGAPTILTHEPASLREPFMALSLNKHHPDAVYSPMQTIGTLGRRYVSVLTIHDLIYYRHRTPPRNLSLPVRLGWRLYHLSYAPERLALKGADVITAVSRTSANDLKKARLTTLPVTVVYNAPQHFKARPVFNEKIIKNIVYMGSFMPYKNVETLIRATEWLPGRSLHLLSRITGKRQAQLEAIIPPSLKASGGEVVFHNGVSDDQYQRLLATNAVLASASLDEGYGLPLAEAMAMGVPVVASDIPIFREVCGNGALYCDPHNPQTFAQAIASLDASTTRQALSAKAQTQSAQFSWEYSARALLTAIEAAVVKKQKGA